MDRVVVSDLPDDNIGAIALVDQLGNSVSSVSKGLDYTVVTSIKNNQRTAQNYTYIVEVFNSRGVVQDIDMFTGTIDAAQLVKIAYASLRAGSENVGYTVKVFLLDESSTILLGRVMETQVAAVNPA